MQKPPWPPHADLEAPLARRRRRLLRRQRCGCERRPALLRKYATLEDALGDGRFPQQADELRLYWRIAAMDATAPLPSLEDQTPTWIEAASLARTWELNRLAERLEEIAAVGAEGS
jgi:hypothetical protein